MWVLGLALVAALVAIVVLARRLAQARRELAEEREALRTVVETPGQRAVLNAGTAVRAVVEAVNRVREQGVGGMLVSSLEDFNRWVAEQRPAIGRMAAADGTVTIFFSDIEGSTSLNATLGDRRWVRLLGAHDRLVETYVEKYRGLVVKTQGDGHMVVFSTPELALDAALDIQRALGASGLLGGGNRHRELRRHGVRVRIGLHTGTAVERSGDYFGQNVALAARVAAQAQGGEVLVTGEIADALAEEFAFASAGTVTLKGFEGAHDLWRVEGRIG